MKTTKKFKPHMMYDPKTGKAYKANTNAAHLEMKEKGYDHRKRKVKKGSGGYVSRYQVGGLRGVPTNLSDTASSNMSSMSRARLNQKLRDDKKNSLRVDKIKKNRGKINTARGTRQFQGGGMYADNTVASAGQGMAGNTSSIVYQESDPRLQEERIKGLQEEVSSAKQQADATAAAAEQTIEQGKMQADIDAQQVEADIAQKEAMTKQGLGVAKELAIGAGIGKAQPGLAGVAKGAMDAYRLQRAANLGAKASKIGMETVKGAKLATKAANLAGKAGGTIGSSAATGATTVTGAGGSAIAAGGSGIGAGLKAFAGSGAGIGLIGAGLGYGVKKLFGDKDPTTANFGDVAGSALSAAGTGASIGSFLGPVGTVAGGIIGGIYGGAKAFFSARKARRAKRKAERAYKRKVRKAVTAANKQTMKGFGDQLAAVRAGETAQKTYSGYDLGRNVIARMGGMKMGMPRYGMAA